MIDITFIRINEQAAKANLTGVELGRLLGLKKSPLTDWKNQKARPTADQIKRLCEIFAVSSDYLLGLSDDPAPETSKPLQQLEGDKGIQMYKSLDDIDRAEIRGEMKHMLKAEKYRQPLIVAARSDNHQPPEPRTLTAEQLRILLTEEGLEQDPNCKL